MLAELTRRRWPSVLVIRLILSWGLMTCSQINYKDTVTRSSSKVVKTVPLTILQFFHSLSCGESLTPWILTLIHLNCCIKVEMFMAQCLSFLHFWLSLFWVLMAQTTALFWYHKPSVAEGRKRTKGHPIWGTAQTVFTPHPYFFRVWDCLVFFTQFFQSMLVYFISCLC